MYKTLSNLKISGRFPVFPQEIDLAITVKNSAKTCIKIFWPFPISLLFAWLLVGSFTFCVAEKLLSKIQEHAELRKNVKDVINNSLVQTGAFKMFMSLILQIIRKASFWMPTIQIIMSSERPERFNVSSVLDSTKLL